MGDQPNKKSFCHCPYCDVELEEPSPFCEPCKVVILTCVKCGGAVREGVDKCPTCGECQA